MPSPASPPPLAAVVRNAHLVSSSRRRDNNTIFNAVIRQRGLRAQRHTRRWGNGSDFAAVVLGAAAAAAGEGWARYGGSLAGFSPELALQLQGGGSGGSGANAPPAGRLSRVAPLPSRADDRGSVAMWAVAQLVAKRPP